MTDPAAPEMATAAVPPIQQPRRDLFRGSGFEAAKRILFLGFLILIMLIPLGMVEGVVQERQYRKQGVIAEVGEQWGPPQEVSPPILVIPYDVVEMRTRSDGQTEAVTVRYHASFLPQATDIAMQAAVDRRYRSLYEVPVYGADVSMRGHFERPDFSRWNVRADQIRWNEASLALLLPGARALRSISFEVDGAQRAIEAGLLPRHPEGKGLRVAFDMTEFAALESKTLDFNLAIALNGRNDLRILPLGGQSQIEIASAWPHPSFLGTPLPNAREITDAGFTAKWSINHLATGIPLAWRTGEFSLRPAEMETVGVRLVEPGDVHQQTDRVVKYALLIVALTFGTIFVVGLLKRDRIHLVQYLLIGAALALFYLLLLSLAEQMSFARAYLIASAVDIAIIGTYAAATIRRVIGLVTGVLLAALQGYVYVLLQMESYALLAGTIGLFVLLVAAMVLTRKVNWFAIGEEARIEAGYPRPTAG